MERVAPFFRVTNVVSGVGVGGTADGRGSHHLTVVGRAVYIRQALGSIESAIRLELTEVGSCTLEELTERQPYYSWNQVFAVVDRLSRDGTVTLQRTLSSDYIISLDSESGTRCQAAPTHPHRLAKYPSRQRLRSPWHTSVSPVLAQCGLAALSTVELVSGGTGRPELTHGLKRPGSLRSVPLPLCYMRNIQ